jgi:transposase
VKIFLCRAPVDLRKSYDSLSGLARDALGENPLMGHLFVFCNRRRTQVKILYWDRDGYAIWQKRLERGTFRLPLGTSEKKQLIGPRELYSLLEGIVPRRYHIRYDSAA